MEALIDILKITIPALIVFLTAWVLIRNMIKNSEDKHRYELMLHNSKTVTPIKLQAYERIVLFLERISSCKGKYNRYDGPATSFRTSNNNKKRV
jgi:hypothetical protein